MEASMFTSFTDMELEDLSFIDHLMQVNSSLEDIFGPPLLSSPSCEDDTCHQQETNNNNNYNQVLGCKISPQIDHHTIIIEEKPVVKQHKPNNNCNSYNNIDNNNHESFISQEDDYSNLNMLSFSSNTLNFSQNCIPEASSHAAKRSGVTLASLSSSKDHILAERKRREKLNQRFIALTATIPGLKKMDKASVLGDALKYVKQLEEQVKKLEELTKTKTIRSAVLVKKSKVFEEEDDQCSTDDAFSSGGSIPSHPLNLEIEAKFSNKDVLIRIHCEKKNGLIEKLISHIENIHLVVINSSALVFGCASIDATIIAQMDAEFSMTIEDLVRDLHVALKRLV